MKFSRYRFSLSVGTYRDTAVNICRLRAVLTMLVLLWLPAPLKVDGASTSNHGSDDGIPIELTSRFSLVLVRLEVNGRPATLVVDTGSSHTILSTQFLQLRGLALGADPSPSKGSGFVGRAAWIKATVHIGDEVLRDHEFLAMEDLPDISNAVGQKIDGIMGEDILKEFAVVEIDFRHRRLMLLR